MSELTAYCTSFNKNAHLRQQDPTQPVSSWHEKDVLHDSIVDAYVIILRTRGCSWAFHSGCTMCGYWNDSMGTEVTEKDLIQQFDHAMERYSNEKIVKIFTSGSFLDEHEIPRNVRKHILQKLTVTTEKVSVESRPEYVKTTALSEVHDLVPSTLFEVGIGLETSSDFIRTHAINKGFRYSDYKKAASLLKNHHMNVKTYVLVKPPFLIEKEAIIDTIQTVKDVAKNTNLISLNPTNVQRNTLVEYLWKRQSYRPPWLWSIIEILKKSQPFTSARLQCDVTGGGNIRGPHNCMTCDQNVIRAISEFSLTQKINVFDDLTCDCREKWYDQLELEQLSFGSCVDFSRWRQ